jgi:hypothetical protein
MAPRGTTAGTAAGTFTTSTQLLKELLKELQAGLPILQQSCNPAAAADLCEHLTAATPLVEALAEAQVMAPGKSNNLLCQVLDMANTYTGWSLEVALDAAASPAISAWHKGATSSSSMDASHGYQASRLGRLGLQCEAPAYEVGLGLALCILDVTLAYADEAGAKATAALIPRLVAAGTGGLLAAQVTGASKQCTMLNALQ